MGIENNHNEYSDLDTQNFSYSINEDDYIRITPERWCTIQYLFGYKQMHCATLSVDGIVEPTANVDPVMHKAIDFAILDQELLNENIRMLIKQYKINYQTSTISSRDKKRIVQTVNNMIIAIREQIEKIQTILLEYLEKTPADSLILWILIVAIWEIAIAKNREDMNQYIFFTVESNMNYFPLVHSILGKIASRFNS